MACASPRQQGGEDRTLTKIGPSFVKIGKAVLYRVDELEAWDDRNRVQCRISKRLEENAGDRA
ncbi:hypothetical protein [Sphingomonas sp.]|uniref:hypothetical protein n=1 Tax=Sphingomonas sp. TaxID=28214 RepID=UPI00258FCD1B|nr:hypothetical protein [Sphingomonas sp.]